MTTAKTDSSSSPPSAKRPRRPSSKIQHDEVVDVADQRARRGPQTRNQVQSGLVERGGKSASLQANIVAIGGAASAKAGQRPVSREKLDALGLNAVADLIASGTSYREVAKKAGVSYGALQDWIRIDADRSRACARAREASGQANDEMAEAVILAATDLFELAKARELAVHYRWRAKAVNPRSYGDRTAVDVNARVEIKASELDARIEVLLRKAEGGR
ncbi:hypothetical protein QN397_15595 [Variovorax sp. RTB1]|uniref:terminase small subunit-like protein n=1 Tax=Variovorax sp. RTB1 TaxID=3048631 RepID=UPI002B229BFB|nr:hypothetical protein [Variovorax sp. RTB1]MEB0112781.1 hypothetical protein [Variovorax sp. RTB1]